MKTLLVSNVFPPTTGGSGRWFWEIYRRLPRDRVVVAAGDCDGAAAFDATHDLDLTRVPLTFSDWGTFSFSGMRRYQRAGRSLRAIVERAGVNLVHCGALLPDGWLAWRLWRKYGIPYVLTLHGEELSYAKSSRQLDLMARRIIGAAKTVLVNSQNTARIARDAWHIRNDRIQILHPGVDCEIFIPAERDPAVRQRLGWNDRTVLLTVGRLQQRKGQDMMIRALPQVRKHIPDVLYAIVGEGEEQSRLEALAQEHGVTDHVHLHGGMGDTDLVRCYQQSDLFVLPNRQIGDDIEGFGMVLLEAQSCGTPVVAGASGGTAETMQPESTGQIVDCTNPETLAAAVVRLLDDPVRCRQMGKAARRWVETHFAWDQLALQATPLLVPD